MKPLLILLILYSFHEYISADDESLQPVSYVVRSDPPVVKKILPVVGSIPIYNKKFEKIKPFLERKNPKKYNKFHKYYTVFSPYDGDNKKVDNIPSASPYFEIDGDNPDRPRARHNLKSVDSLSRHKRSAPEDVNTAKEEKAGKVEKAAQVEKAAKVETAAKVGKTSKAEKKLHTMLAPRKPSEGVKKPTRGYKKSPLRPLKSNSTVKKSSAFAKKVASGPAKSRLAKKQNLKKNLRSRKPHKKQGKHRGKRLNKRQRTLRGGPKGEGNKRAQRNKVARTKKAQKRGQRQRKQRPVQSSPIKKVNSTRRLIASLDATIEEFPFVVSIQKDEEHWCTGALLNPRLIITTANCLWKSNHVSRMRIRAGSRRTFSGGQKAKIQEVRKHPRFNIRSGAPDCDIALALLDRNIKFSDKVHEADLPNVNMQPPFNDVWVASWGAIRRDGMYESDHGLQWYHANRMDQAKCRNITFRYNVHVSDNFFCLVQTARRAPCTRDTGAPAVSDGVIWGLASFGLRKSCGTERLPAMYSYVASPSNMEFIVNATSQLMSEQRFYPFLDKWRE